MPGWPLSMSMSTFFSSQRDRRTKTSSQLEEGRRSGAQGRRATTPPTGSRRNSNTDSLESNRAHERPKRRSHRDSSTPTYGPGGQYRESSGLPEPTAASRRASDGPGKGGEPPTTEPNPIVADAGADSRLQDALRTWETQKMVMEETIKAFQVADVQRAAEANQLHLELQSANKRLAQWEESYDSVQGQLKSTRTESKIKIEEMTRDLTRVGQENENLLSEKAKLLHQLEELNARLEAGDNELWKSKKLLETRTQELTVAQTFLTTADQHSIADVSQMVEELNEEIYQCSMMMSDALIEQRANATKRGDKDHVYRTSACQPAEQRWGRDLLSRLQVDVSNEETTLFESLLENALVARCYQIIQSFSLESHEFENRCLAMWDGIKRSYETPVAKRWLAMTHSQLKSQMQSMNLHDGIMHDLGSLMAAGGWSEQTEGSSVLPGKVQEKVGQLTERAFKIKEAVTEGILSVDVDVFYFGDDVPYHPATMQDACDVGGHSEIPRTNAETIICSTGLGVRCVTRARHSSEQRPGRQKQYEVVLKPKVLLPSALEPA